MGGEIGGPDGAEVNALGDHRQTNTDRHEAVLGESSNGHPLCCSCRPQVTEGSIATPKLLLPLSADMAKADGVT